METKQKENFEDHSRGQFQSILEQEDSYSGKLTSQFHDVYLNFIQNIKTQQQKKQLQKILSNKNIFIHQMNFKQDLQFQIVETDLQSFKLYLYYGYYKLKVNVLTTSLGKNFLNSPLLSYGSYGTIYSIAVAQDFCAVKRVQLDEKSFDSDLKQVYKQYFLLKIGSILNVGPKAYTPFGYDIVVTPNEAFFAMELCLTEKMQKLNEIEKESLENLRLMHSLNFLHLDIKPANLAYSLVFKKCVFIDFGLSRFIMESVGDKTVTSFVGTLSYCSEEMKNTYFLNKKRPVDMYYNDIISFQRTLRIIKERNLFKSQDEVSDCISSTKYYQFSRTLNIIEESIYVFQLKYYIFERNTELFIRVLPKMLTMPKCFFQILDHKVTQRFIDKNELVKPHIAEIKAKILKKKYIGNLVDKILSQALSKAHQNDSLFGFKFSQLAINLPTYQFQQILGDQVFISNILLYLEEFLKQNSPFSQKSIIATKLIKKVNLCCRPKKQNDLLLFQQISYFLRLINQRLQKNRAYKMLSILRLLFVKMQDLKPIQSIQDEILTQITDPTIKCLKITQFLLFWQYALVNFQYYKQERWKRIIKDLQANKRNPLFNKVRYFCMLILQNINQRHKQELNERKTIQRLIQQCNKNLQQKEVLSLISIIEVMFLWSSKFQKQLLVKNPVLQAYEAYIPSLKFTLAKPFELSAFDRLFWSYVWYVKKLTREKKVKNNKKRILQCISYAFMICQNRMDLISQQLFYHLFEELIEKKMVFFILQKFQQSIRLMLLQKNQFLDSVTKSFMLIIQNSLDLLASNQNSKMLLENEKLSSQQQSLISNRLKGLINSFKQKVADFNQAKSDTFAAFCCIYEIKLTLRTTRIQDSVKKQVISVYLSLNIKCQHAIILALFCETLKQLVGIEGKSWVEDIIIQLCQSHLKLQNPFLLQSHWSVFIQYIYINVKRNQNNRNKALIEQIIRHEQKTTKNLQVLFFQSKSTTFLIEAFCYSTNFQILKSIYDQISFQKCQFNRCCYAFYILFLFQVIYPKFYSQKQVIIRQLKRSCICLKNMSHLHSFISQGIILSFIGMPILIKSERKRLICSRMSVRGIEFKKEGGKRHIKLLKVEAKKIKNQRVKEKVIGKIEKLQLQWQRQNQNKIKQNLIS